MENSINGIRYGTVDNSGIWLQSPDNQEIIISKEEFEVIYTNVKKLK